LKVSNGREYYETEHVNLGPRHLHASNPRVLQPVDKKASNMTTDECDRMFKEWDQNRDDVIDDAEFHFPMPPEQMEIEM